MILLILLPEVRYFLQKKLFTVQQIEDYLNFLAPNDIRIKGTRIGIESILYEYIYKSRTPEEIQQIYPTLTLEQIYATILYYHHQKAKFSEYIADWLETSHQQIQAQTLNPHPAAARLEKLRQEREAKTKAHDAKVPH